MFARSKCKKCGADIRWCMMGTGAKVPLNVKPQKLIQVKYGIGELIDVYESHFAQCAGSEEAIKAILEKRRDHEAKRAD